MIIYNRLNSIITLRSFLLHHKCIYFFKYKFYSFLSFSCDFSWVSFILLVQNSIKIREKIFQRSLWILLHPMPLKWHYFYYSIFQLILITFVQNVYITTEIICFNLKLLAFFNYILWLLIKLLFSPIIRLNFMYFILKIFLFFYTFFYLIWNFIFP